MTRWTLSIPDKTDVAVRMYIARKGGKKGDLSRFVDEAVRAKIFNETVKQVKDKNADADQQEIMTLIDEAVDVTRADHP